MLIMNFLEHIIKNVDQIGIGLVYENRFAITLMHLYKYNTSIYALHVWWMRLHNKQVANVML